MFEVGFTCLLSDLPDIEGLPGVASVKVAIERDDPRLAIIRDWQADQD
jgi:hypothetical protein